MLEKLAEARHAVHCTVYMLSEIARAELSGRGQATRVGKCTRTNTLG
jgi:hypothetical protein